MWMPPVFLFFFFNTFFTFLTFTTKIVFFTGTFKKNKKGHAPVLPEKYTGFWQSKLRYYNDSQVLDIVHEYIDQGIPLSVIVIDFFHWTELGDWQFDPDCFPDPGALVAELNALGVVN